MGRIRRLIRGGLSRVSAAVSRNELFEKPGERSPTPKLSPRTASRPTYAQRQPPPSAAAAVPAPAPVTAEPRATAAPSHDEPSATQEMLSVAILDLPALRTWLGAGRGLRVINHWASWCIPCVEEFDMLKSLHAQLPDGVPLEGLSWDLFDPRGDEDDIAEHVANFSSGHSLPWTSVLIGEAVDPADFFEAFSITNETVPQTWVVDDAGAVVYRVDGVLTEAHIEPLLSAIYNTDDDFGDDEHGG